MKFRALLLAAAAALIATSAQASYTFSGAIDAGPLTSAAFTGSYDYDLAALTGSGFESLALSAFELDFQSQVFGLNAAATADYQDGVFLGLSYATSGVGYDLSMTSGSMDLSDAFLHYTQASGTESSGGYTVATAARLPEPASLALTFGALAALGAVRRRNV